MTNITKDGTVGIINKLRELMRTLKRARVGSILNSSISLPMGSSNADNMNCKRHYVQKAE